MVLDASVLIAHFDAEDVHHRRAAALLLATPEEPLHASQVTLAEVLVGPARAGRLQEALAAVADLAVLGVDLAHGCPARLATLRAESGLKLPDCCVLLAAEEVGGTIATFDPRLAAAARSRGLRVLEHETYA
ncbi:MAG: type II toxin-antitoxin system VapC family toxin [Chloroflexota bacterium]